MVLITPLALFVAGVIVIYFFFKNKNQKLLFWMILIFAITFLIEAIGVKSGKIFGSYSYNSTLGFKFLNVPLIIGFNWLLVILGAINISKFINGNAFTSALLAAVLAFLFDIFLEPSAVKLDYWSWDAGIIPLQNYFAWFLISFLAAVSFNFLKIEISSKMAAFNFILQLIFFIVLFLFIKIGIL